jgi:hypothetical protein
VVALWHLWQTAVLIVPTDDVDDSDAADVVVDVVNVVDDTPAGQDHVVSVTVEICVTGTAMEVVAHTVEVDGAGHDVAPQPLAVRVTGKHLVCPKFGDT